MQFFGPTPVAFQWLFQHISGSEKPAASDRKSNEQYGPLSSPPLPQSLRRVVVVIRCVRKATNTEAWIATITLLGDRYDNRT